MVHLADRPVESDTQRRSYDPLYDYLVRATGDSLRMSFTDLEAILGFSLPPSARLQRQWWSNERHGNGRTHVLAWNCSGWMVQDVNLDSETLVFTRVPGFPKINPELRAKALREAKKKKKFDIEKNWPVVSGGGPWLPGFTVSRRQIYDESGRLTGGPQDESDLDY